MRSSSTAMARAALALAAALAACMNDPARGTITEAPAASLGAIDAASGSWTLTGNMTRARYSSVAVRLNDGRVLQLGGLVRTPRPAPVGPTELYDPATGAWTIGNSLNDIRIAATATVLPNGQVLAAGGCANTTCATSSSTAELYDPATGVWSAIASLNTPHSYHTATLLKNGRVLVAGGCFSTCGIYAGRTAELYDPVTGTWTPTGSMAIARAQHTAALLPNGKVLVSGGLTDLGAITASAELYDPATGTWSPAASMLNARRLGQAVSGPGGRVLVIGGADATTMLAAAEFYTPKTNRWTATASMSTPRAFFAAVALPTPVGKVLVMGGADGALTLSSAELFDPVTRQWTATGNMNVARYSFTATLLGDGRVLVAGAYPGIASTELYWP